MDAQDLIQAVIGCEWGRKVSAPDDDQRCQDVAHCVVVVYDPDGENPVAVKVCPKHKSRLMEESTPHEFDE